MDKAAVRGEFCTFRHIKTRKAFVIEIEFPEEQGQEVLKVLGMPIGGESKPVAIALLDKSNLIQSDHKINKIDKTEGEKLRTRAIMLCIDKDFQRYVVTQTGAQSERPELVLADYIRAWCNIQSRSELATNLDAQQRFKLLLERYKTWQLENDYKDNLGRV